MAISFGGYGSYIWGVWQFHLGGMVVLFRCMHGWYKECKKCVLELTEAQVGGHYFT